MIMQGFYQKFYLPECFRKRGGLIIVDKLWKDKKFSAFLAKNRDQLELVELMGKGKTDADSIMSIAAGKVNVKTLLGEEDLGFRDVRVILWGLRIG